MSNDRIIQDVDAQKLKYEQKREQEKKRRFAILSGNFTPISTSIHLQSGEHAYYECPAQRMADREHTQSYTTGKARSPFIQGGILRGNTKIDTSTIHQRITSKEVIDNGKMLFTNKRIVFIGKAVVSLPYDDILSVEFDDSQMLIKYPQMLTNEGYELDRDAQFYYQGLMHFIGRDKDKITEESTDMSDYPEYVSEEVKEAIRKKSFTKNAIIFIVIAVLIVFLFHGISMDVFIISIFVFLCSLISYPILYASNKGTGQYEEGLQVAKTIFFWSIPIMIFCFILAIATYH